VAGREIRLGGSRVAAEAWLGRPTDAQVEVALAGRLELREGEVRDGAHTPEAVDWLLERLPRPHDYTVVASILADKDADGILERLGQAGPTLVATRSSNGRALPTAAVADRGRRSFATVVEVDDPRLALAYARELGKPVLVTGSLYLLADLSKED
jgi:folylpolyglutamate synthase/dihydropteroate synthase